MNSSFTVTDLTAFSPYDLGVPDIMKVTTTTSGATKRKASSNNDTEEEFKVFVQPKILGRRVDPGTRRIFPNIEQLSIEPHSFTMTMDLVTPELLAKEEKNREKQTTTTKVTTKPNNVPNTVQKSILSSTTTTSSNTSVKPLQTTAAPIHNNSTKVVTSTSSVNGSITKSSPSSTPKTSPRKIITKGSGSSQTALVRLSSGKVVRVPIELVRQRQAFKTPQGHHHMQKDKMKPPLTNEAVNQVLKQMSPVTTKIPTLPTAPAPIESLSKSSVSASVAATSSVSSPIKIFSSSMATTTTSTRVTTTGVCSPVKKTLSVASTLKTNASPTALINGQVLKTLPNSPGKITLNPGERLVKIRTSQGPTVLAVAPPPTSTIVNGVAPSKPSTQATNINNINANTTNLVNAKITNVLAPQTIRKVIKRPLVNNSSCSPKAIPVVATQPSFQGMPLRVGVRPAGNAIINGQRVNLVIGQNPQQPSVSIRHQNPQIVTQSNQGSSPNKVIVLSQKTVQQMFQQNGQKGLANLTAIRGANNVISRVQLPPVVANKKVIGASPVIVSPTVNSISKTGPSPVSGSKPNVLPSIVVQNGTVQNSGSETIKLIIPQTTPTKAGAANNS